MSNEIQLYQQLTDPLKAISQLGEMVAKSGMFSCEKTEQGQIIAWACLAERKSPFEIQRTFHLLPGGRLTKKGMAIFADFIGIGGSLKWIQTGDEAVKNEDDRTAVADITYKGQTIRFAYGIKDAKLEGLYDKKGSRYKTAPGEMLRSKIHTKGICLLAPQLVAGGDDGEDYTPAPEATLNLAPEKPAVEVVVEKVYDKSKTPAENVAATNAGAKNLGEDEKELAAAGLAPEQKPTQETAAASLEFTPELLADGKLSIATVEGICKKLGGDKMKLMPQVTEKMILKTWIEKDGDLSKLSLARANQIARHTAQAFYAQFGIAV